MEGDDAPPSTDPGARARAGWRVRSSVLASELAESTRLRDRPRPVHLVAKIGDNLIGHVSFSPVRQKGLQKRIGYILAPLAVAPAWQKRGIGSALVKGGLSRFELQEDGIVFVYGDPGYYQRFGFSRELAENFLPPYPPRYPSGWQALKLDARKLPDAPVSIECVGALCLPMIW